jgi:hypothetical protein
MKIKTILMVLLLAVGAYGFDLKKVMEIGSDSEENYIFFKPGPIAVDKDGNIYAVESESNTIRKYDPQGVFVKKTGRTGQGPLEFINITSLAVQKNFLLLYDLGNKRMSRYDLDLNFVKSENLSGIWFNIAVNDEYYIANKKKGPSMEIVLRKPFSDWEKKLQPVEEISIADRHKNSPLAQTLLRNLFSADESSQGFVSTQWHPGTGSLSLLFVDQNGNRLRKISTEPIVANYEFDERYITRSDLGKSSGKLLWLWEIHYINEANVLVQYNSAKNGKDVDESGLVLLDAVSGKIKKKLILKDKLNIRCTHQNRAYGYVFDSGDIEIKLAVFEML